MHKGLNIRISSSSLIIIKIPYSMSWSTSNVFDPQVSGSRTNGDAIIACSNFGVDDGDVWWHLDMDAVGVGAVSIGQDLHSLQLHVLASIEHYVEHLTVHWGQPTDGNVIGVGERQCLNTQHNKTTVSSNSPLLYKIYE